MRLRGFPVGAQAPSPAAGGAEAESSGSVNPLFGTWSATRWQYTSQEDAPRMVDLVADLEGMVTLSLSAGTYVLTHDVAGRGHHSMGGSCVIRDEMLELHPEGAGEAESVRFRVAGDTLALTAAESGWEFDDEGRETPATLVAVFVRL